jgi:hypothetical protein
LSKFLVRRPLFFHSSLSRLAPPMQKRLRLKLVLTE